MLLFLNIGGSEIILILFIILIIWGPSKIPEIARGLGKGIKQINDAGDFVKREINKEIRKAEVEDETKIQEPEKRSTKMENNTNKDLE